MNNLIILWITNEIRISNIILLDSIYNNWWVISFLFLKYFVISSFTVGLKLKIMVSIAPCENLINKKILDKSVKHPSYEDMILRAQTVIKSRIVVNE